jgi:general secretion pathway protein A
MYCQFFGFSEKPFDVTPDPSFLYLTAGHREALSALIYGIRERRGFVVLIGEVGTGKTTLLNALSSRLDQNVHMAFIFNTDMSFQQMLNMALIELGLTRPEEHLTKVKALHRLNHFAAQELAWGGNVVLVVDEAQNLDQSSLENLRLLSNLETPKHKMIQIVLAGQPELVKKLRAPELRQLAQRISIKGYITPLSRQKTYNYIRHRLMVAGHRGAPLFEKHALQRIWEFSGGVPRRINIISDNALLIGYALGKKKITESMVEEAIMDLGWSSFSDSGMIQRPVLLKLAVPPERKFLESWFAKTPSLIVNEFSLFRCWAIPWSDPWKIRRKTGRCPTSVQ